MELKYAISYDYQDGTHKDGLHGFITYKELIEYINDNHRYRKLIANEQYEILDTNCPYKYFTILEFTKQ